MQRHWRRSVSVQIFQAASIVLGTLLPLLAGCGRKPVEPAQGATIEQPLAQEPERNQAAPAKQGASAPAASVAQGRELYSRMCSVCHGADGEGYRADQAPRLNGPNFLASATDEFLRVVIAEGRAGTTMSAWAKERGGPLSASEVDSVVAFLRSLGPQERRVDQRKSEGDPARGLPLYQRHCAVCHGEKGQGGQAPRIGDGRFLQTANDGFLRLAIVEGRPKTPMPAFRGRLRDDEIEDIVALLRSWEPKTSPKEPSVEAPVLVPGKVAINPKGPEPKGFSVYPKMTGVETVKRELDRGAKMAFLDARASSDYLREHIQGAVSVPFYEVSKHLAALPKDTWLICYCACPHAASGKLANHLLEKGFKKVTVLDEGILFWKNKGYPLSSGSRH